MGDYTRESDREMFYRAIGVVRGLDSIFSINILLGLQTENNYSDKEEGRVHSSTAASVKMLKQLSLHVVLMSGVTGPLLLSRKSPYTKDTKPPRMKPHDQAIKSLGKKK